jgi:hypothetical protein
VSSSRSTIQLIHNPADLAMLGSRILPAPAQLSRPILLSALVPAVAELLLPW